MGGRNCEVMNSAKVKLLSFTRTDVFLYDVIDIEKLLS